MERSGGVCVWEEVWGGVRGGAASPDAEVRAAGVVASDRGDSAGVGADVARPGLGDVQGAVGVGAHARDGLHVDGHALLLPHVSGREARSFWAAAEPANTPANGGPRPLRPEETSFRAPDPQTSQLIIPGACRRRSGGFEDCFELRLRARAPLLALCSAAPARTRLFRVRSRVDM